MTTATAEKEVKKRHLKLRWWDFSVADSSADVEPAFASFAVAVDDDEDGEEDAPKQKPPLPPRGKLVEEAAARSNEWKLRRQELHKRLEVLHQRQQFDV